MIELANIALTKCAARKHLDAVSEISGTVIFVEFDQYGLFDVTCIAHTTHSLLLCRCVNPKVWLDTFPHAVPTRQ